MDGQTLLGRGIAAVGVGLALAAIWVQYISVPVPAKYWDDGTFGGLLLALAVLAALALAGAYATNQRDYDVAVGAIGGVGFGLYLFFPGVFAFDQWDFLDAGSWLGLCSALTFIGAIVATWPSDRPAGRPAIAGVLIALVGLALIIAALFPAVENGGGGSYWNITGAGHSYGLLLIVLVVLEALAIGAAHSMTEGMDSAIFIGAVTLGATIAVPVGEAFDQFGDLATGAWLAGIGGIVQMAGILLMRLLATETAAPQAVPATPPPTAAP